MSMWTGYTFTPVAKMWQRWILFVYL